VSHSRRTAQASAFATDVPSPASAAYIAVDRPHPHPHPHAPALADAAAAAATQHARAAAVLSPLEAGGSAEVWLSTRGAAMEQLQFGSDPEDSMDLKLHTVLQVCVLGRACCRCACSAAHAAHARSRSGPDSAARAPRQSAPPLLQVSDQCAWRDALAVPPPPRPPVLGGHAASLTPY
jgi:hypothetical protein